MAINYAEKYSQIVDERFKVGALTSALLNRIRLGRRFHSTGIFCTDCYNGGLQDRWR